MSKLIDLVGQRFGRLTVISRAENDKRGVARWLCKCDCGGFTTAFGKDLRKGHTNSCGCFQKERASESNVTHNLKSTKLYSVWGQITQRCINKSNKSYKNYGGRGITVCDE